MANKYQGINTSNYQLETIQRDLKKATDNLLSAPDSAANYLFNVQLSGGLNTIRHNLGRKLQGWQILDKQGDAVVFRVTGSVDEKVYLQLSASKAEGTALKLF